MFFWDTVYRLIPRYG